MAHEPNLSSESQDLGQKPGRTVIPDSSEDMSLAATELLDESGYDPALSVGASINETLMAPAATTRESRDEYQASEDLLLTQAGGIPHQGADGELGSPGLSGPEFNRASDSSLSLSSDGRVEGETDVRAADELDLQGQERAANSGIASEGSMAVIGTSPEDVAEGDDEDDDGAGASRTLKERTARIEQMIKAQPFAFALGAAGLGFALGRMFKGVGTVTGAGTGKIVDS